MSVGKGPEIHVGVAPSANSYHDNPVGGIHQAPSHWATTHWKEIVKLTHTYQEGWEGREQKRSMSQLAKGNASLTTTGDLFLQRLGAPRVHAWDCPPALSRVWSCPCYIDVTNVCRTPLKDLFGMIYRTFSCIRLLTDRGECDVQLTLWSSLTFPFSDEPDFNQSGSITSPKTPGGQSLHSGKVVWPHLLCQSFPRC